MDVNRYLLTLPGIGRGGVSAAHLNGKNASGQNVFHGMVPDCLNIVVRVAQISTNRGKGKPQRSRWREAWGYALHWLPCRMSTQ
jgi:hypothetical protein